MVRKLGKFQTKKTVRGYEQASHLNKEGFPSFKANLADATLQNLMCNVIEGSYYVPVNDLFDQSFDLYSRMLTEDAELFAKMIVYARNKGYMRTQPILGTVFLSTLVDKTLVKKVFNRVMRTPKDILAMIDLCNTGLREKVTVPRKGLGTTLKKLVNSWLGSKLSEYWAIKYPTELKKMIKMSHPKFGDGIPTKAWGLIGYTSEYKYEKSKGVTDEAIAINIKENYPKLQAYNDLKAATEPGEILRLIKEGQLTHETVTGICQPETDGWTALMYQMPYFALLRHLATLNRNGVFSNPEHASFAANKLNNLEAIQKVKVLPFRYLQAAKAAQGLPPRIKTALDYAMEKSFANVPKIPGKICIGTDVSGSMGSHPTILRDRNKGSYSGKTSSYTFAEIAGILTMGLARKNRENTIVYTFNFDATPFNFDEFNSIMEGAQWFVNKAGGGTALSSPIQKMIDNALEIDTFIGITDNEDWVGKGAEPVLEEYRRNFNPNLHAFLIRIDPYADDVAISPKNPLNHFIAGWNANILKFIPLVLEGSSMVEEIRKTEL